MVSWICDDHEKKCKLIYVAISIISGASDINFEIDDDGLKVKLNYTWPTAIFNPKELFAHELKNVITPDNPKIHTMVTHLLSSGITEKSRPRGKILISLPIKVQREMDTWQKHAIKCPDGTKVALLEFRAYQENTVIKHADTSLCFD